MHNIITYIFKQKHKLSNITFFFIFKVNCNLLDYPCSKESPFKICLPVHDGYMEGVCFQDPTRPNPDEPVLSFIYDGLSQDQTEQLSLRWDIPNNPLRNHLFC